MTSISINSALDLLAPKKRIEDDERQSHHQKSQAANAFACFVEEGRDGQPAKASNNIGMTAEGDPRGDELQTRSGVDLRDGKTNRQHLIDKDMVVHATSLSSSSTP